MDLISTLELAKETAEYVGRAASQTDQHVESFISGPSHRRRRLARCGSRGVRQQLEQAVFAFTVLAVLWLISKLRREPAEITMVEVTVRLPDNAARTFGETPEDMSRHLLENAAIEEYRTGRLSHRQVGEMLGLDYWQAESFLTEHRVPLNYSAAELEADRTTLERILGKK